MAEQTKTPEQWLEQFYTETNSAKREKCLEKFALSGGGGALAEKLRQLWDLRYRKSRQGTADSFLAAWLDLSHVSGNASSHLLKGSNFKLVHKALDTLCLSGGTQLSEDLLFPELKNLALCYITIYLETYRQNILGIPIRTGRTATERKIREDVFNVTVELPRKYGMEREFSLLTAAAQKALEEGLPRDEEPELI